MSSIQEADASIKIALRDFGGDKYNVAVEAIVQDFSTRAGLGDEWDRVDSGIQDEIKDVWRTILHKVFG